MSSGPQLISASDVRDVSTVQKQAIGSQVVTRDGRVYVYGNMGSGGAAAAGDLAVAEAIVSGHTNKQFYAAAAVGAKQVKLKTASTAVTANQYQDGYLVVNDATGEGIAYQISGNGAASIGNP